jgi:peroxiredoxin
MANNLTGDFDVVAQFSLPAVDRVLAAMHQCERLLHSIAVRVDDNPLPGTKVNYPTAVGVVDAFGDAIADQGQMGGTPVLPGAGAASDALLSRLGAVLNPGDLVANEGTIAPSNLQGIAQLQLYAPTVSVPPQPDSITVITNVMVRYFPDKNTAPLAEFMRGDVQITAPMNKIASGSVHVLNIDFKAQDAIINFTPSYSSKALSAEDLVAINLCIQNGLRTSFLPSSVTLPSSVADVQLKTLPGTVAVLLNLSSHPAAVASVTNVFLAGGDDFAFAAGRDYIFNTLGPIVDAILSQPPLNITVTFGYHFSFLITLNSASFDLQPGKIVLNINAHAQPTNHTWVGSADFTIAVEFFLQPSGNTVQLGVGNVSISFNTSLTGAFADLVDYFTGDVSSSVKNAVMNALNAANAFAIVDQMFNADTNLGNFINAQLSSPDGTPPPQPQQISLMYTAADIQSAGVVLRGLLLLKPWPDPYVEYEPIATSGSQPINRVVSEQDYSALKTWIPGGRVDQYEWSYQGQTTPFEVDPNRFVLMMTSILTQPGSVMARTTALAGYTPLCLTVRGTQIRNYGPGVNPQPVSARVCGYTRFPIVLGGLVATAGAVPPMIALTHPGPGGEVVVTGQASVQTSQTGRPVPNLIVHFADAKSAAQLEVLTEALKQSKKKRDAATAIVAVLQPGQLAKSPFVPGVTYSEDSDAAWEGLLGLKSVKVPLTGIVTPAGKVAWQTEGMPDLESLAAALDKNLISTGAVQITVPRLNVRIGQTAANFVFELASGREMPLSKLRGRGVTLVFWKAASRASIDAVRAVQAASSKSSGTVVLAVNDGDAAQIARTVAAESGFSDALVADPQRNVSSAYGVEIWPTLVSLNASGVITAIRYGYGSSGQ